MRAPARALAILAVVALGCGRGEDAPPEPARPIVAFDSTRVAIVTEADTIPLTVELAETETQRAYGLMERDSLPPDHGMLFTYAEDQPPGAGFWMWRTRIPLDIAFVDASGRIASIRSMEPCPSRVAAECPSYPPGVVYRVALEMPAGWFERHGVDVDDRLIPLEEGEANAPREAAPDTTPSASLPE